MSVKQRLINQVRKKIANPRFDIILSKLLAKHPETWWLKKLVPGNTYYPKGSLRHYSNDGIVYQLDISDYPDWSLYFQNASDSSRSLLQFVERGDFILDIGGNIGQTALMLAQKVTESGRVISFEPFPSTRERFRVNLSLNSEFKNITLEAIGIGDKNETLRMRSACQTNSAANRIVSSNDSIEYVEVSVRCLDDYLNESVNIDRIDLIKIDVEGFEMRVLNGAKASLSKFKPKLFIEVNDENLRSQGSSNEEVVIFLQSLGYRIKDVTTNKEIKFHTELVTHTDIYCFR